MNPLCGCAAIIGFMVFSVVLLVLNIAGLVYPPFQADTGFGVQAGLAAMLAGNVSLAFLLLMLRDSWRHRATLRKVRAERLPRFDVGDEELAAAFPGVDPALLIRTRAAVAEFYDIPPGKIHPEDNLHDDLLIDVLEPSFHMHVIFCVAQLSEIEMLSPAGELQPFLFSTSQMTSLEDLALGVGQVLEQRSGSGEDSGENTAG